MRPNWIAASPGEITSAIQLRGLAGRDHSPADGITPFRRHSSPYYGMLASVLPDPTPFDAIVTVLACLLVLLGYGTQAGIRRLTHRSKPR
jgi:hypothetical protein